MTCDTESHQTNSTYCTVELFEPDNTTSQAGIIIQMFTTFNIVQRSATVHYYFSICLDRSWFFVFIYLSFIWDVVTKSWESHLKMDVSHEVTFCTATKQRDTKTSLNLTGSTHSRESHYFRIRGMLCCTPHLSAVYK